MSSLRDHDPASVGMMEGAFFVPRKELLEWVNATFQLNLTKVEQCASGAVYLQIVDNLFPGKVPMSKVKWSATLEYEFIHNYKILQDVFNKKSINKHIEVDKLIKGKYQDNLEFLQWMKAYWERQMEGSEDRRNYDAAERRKLSCSPMPDWASMDGCKENRCKTDKGMRGSNPLYGATPNIKGSQKTPTASASPPDSKAALSTLPPPQVQVAATKTKLIAKEEEIGKLQELLRAEQLERQTAEQEKDFYFNKLREIEILCQEDGVEQLPVAQIQTILYATGDVEGEEEIVVE